MELQLDLSKQYGIVLEGGGARGAYQIGAWQALRETGVQIRGIAGTSVGALNGALVCMDDLERARRLWEQISYSKVMDVDDAWMDSLRNRKLKNLELKQAAANAGRVIRNGGFDIGPLKKLIRENIDVDKIRQSDRELFITTFSLEERKGLVVDVKKLPAEEIGDALLASAYLIGFRNEKLGGKRYVDGGSFNNVPVDVLLDRGYEDILVIRIYGLGIDTEKTIQIPDGVRVGHIAPRQELGGILEFDSRKARRNMQLGYYDAMRFLYDLQGRRYYFDAPQSETYYFERMMGEADILLRNMQEMFGIKGMEAGGGCRVYTEQIFPALAQTLRLKPEWDYRDLYLSVLEAWARRLRISRFAVYTPDELAKMIFIQAGKLDRAFPV